MLKATAAAQYVVILIDLIEGMGHGRKALLAGTGLAQTDSFGIGTRVDTKAVTQLVANALALTGDPGLGLKLGQRLNLSAHAVLGQTFMVCANLRQALPLLIKYCHLLASDLELELEVAADRCTVTTVSAPLSHSMEFTYELIFGAMHNTLLDLLNLPRINLKLEMPYPEPSHGQSYCKIFGENVHFNCPQGRISTDSTLLDRPLPSSNPALRALYENECRRLLAELEQETSVSAQTLHWLRKFAGRYPQMPVIAQMLNLSPRTFRRRLQAEDQSFQALLDRVRAEHATYYLRKTRLPLAAIANQLGFDDASNFRRAYIRWTGQSPNQVRRVRGPVYLR